MTDAVSPVAARVIAKAGGFQAVAEITGVTVKQVYCWTYSRKKGGTGGRIPHDHQEKLLAGAIDDDGKPLLSPADFFERAA